MRKSVKRNATYVCIVQHEGVAREMKANFSSSIEMRWRARTAHEHSTRSRDGIDTRAATRKKKTHVCAAASAERRSAAIRTVRMQGPDSQFLHDGT